MKLVRAPKSRQFDTYVIRSSGESMIDTSGQNNKIILLQSDTNPFVTLISYVEEASSVANISDLLILVQVLVEEGLDLFLVDVAHFLWGDGYHIAILV